jgi:hypothetical protein
MHTTLTDWLAIPIFVQNRPYTEVTHGHGVIGNKFAKSLRGEFKERQMPTDTAHWRVAVVVVVTDAVAQLVASGKMAQRMFDDERLETFNAQTAGDDAALMRYLKHYCPNDPHVQSYPGRDDNTTGAPSSSEQQ